MNEAKNLLHNFFYIFNLGNNDIITISGSFNMANKVIILCCIHLILSAALSESLDGEFNFQCFEEDVKGKFFFAYM